MSKSSLRPGSSLVGIDLARAFGALSVFVYHYGVGGVLAKATGVRAFELLSAPGASYGVPLFFAVSGFCIHWSQMRQEQLAGESRIHLPSYAWRRFWRIYPTYLVALLFSCAVAGMGSDGGRVGVMDFLVHATLLQAFSVSKFNSINVVLWTISVEAMLYALYPVWHGVRRRIGLNASVGLGMLVSLASWTFFALRGPSHTFPVVYFVTNLWGAWLVGAWLSEQVLVGRTLLASAPWRLAGVAFIIATVMLVVRRAFEGRFDVAATSVFTIAWIWPLAALILAEERLRGLRGISGALVAAFKRCGQISYSLYLLHMPVMYFRNALWADIASPSARIVIWGSAFIGTLCVSWLSYQTFEKPFIRVSTAKTPVGMRLNDAPSPAVDAGRIRGADSPSLPVIEGPVRAQ